MELYRRVIFDIQRKIKTPQRAAVGGGTQRWEALAQVKSSQDLLPWEHRAVCEAWWPSPLLVHLENDYTPGSDSNGPPSTVSLPTRCPIRRPPPRSWHRGARPAPSLLSSFSCAAFAFLRAAACSARVIVGILEKKLEKKIRPVRYH